MVKKLRIDKLMNRVLRAPRGKSAAKAGDNRQAVRNALIELGRLWANPRTQPDVIALLNRYGGL